MANELVTSNTKELIDMAQIMSKSGLFGKSAEQLASLMMIAQAEGRHPATVAMEYDVIQGKPALNSRTALARFQSAGGKIKWIESNATMCTAEFTHEQGGTLQITWTIERAKEANLTGKDTWRKYPDQMLRARCIAEGVRAVLPACLGALYLVEEVSDFDDKPKRQIKSRGVDVIVEDDPPMEDGKGSFQISESVNAVFKKIKENELNIESFTRFLREKKKIDENQYLNTMSEELAQKILGSWENTEKVYLQWVNNPIQEDPQEA